jgi:hypothetical protein
MPFVAISVHARWQQENAFVLRKFKETGFGELRTEPGKPIETLNQNLGGDCFPKILENEPRE